MYIHIFYNSSVLSQSQSAEVTRHKYYSQYDADGNINSVTLHDVKGLSNATIDAVTYLLSAASVHRIFNFATNGTGTGQISTAQVAYLTTKLITSATDSLSDDAVITIAPAGSDSKTQQQNAWNAVWCFKTMPDVHEVATAGGATSITHASAGWTVDAYTGHYVHIISGTGAGQIRQIVSNTSSALTVSTWTATPDSTSVFQITPSMPKTYPPFINHLLGLGSYLDNGTASSGGNTTLTDSTKSGTWTTNLYANCYVYILGGTGAGQYRKIISNTTTALTVATWVTNPDSSSTYMIVQRESEVFLYPYVYDYCYTYMRDLSSASVLSLYTKMYDCYNNIHNQGIGDPTSLDTNYWDTVVLALGKAMYDYSIS